MNEQQLCENISDYLSYQHSDIVYHFDFGSGVRLNMGQAMKQKRLNKQRAWPDLFVAQPHHGYAGLFIELKKEGYKVFKKDGTLRKNAHLEEQAEMLERLNDLGYKAVFGVGFEQTVNIIKNYLGVGNGKTSSSDSTNF